MPFVDTGLARGKFDAVDHRNFSIGKGEDSRLIQNGRNPFEPVCGYKAFGQMKHGNKGVGLAAAKGGLELDDRIASHAGKPFCHGKKEKPHSLCDEGSGEKLFRILIFFRRFTGSHLG